MIKPMRHNTNKGFTIIEMAVVILVFSIAGLGFLSTAIGIVGFYQDDMVSRDIKTYGTAVLSEIADKISQAQEISVTSGPNGYDLVYLTFPGTGNIGRQKSIQASEDRGFLYQGKPLLKKIPLKQDGMYRNHDYRQIDLLEFTVENLHEAGYHHAQNRNELRLVGKSVYEVTIIYGLTTYYKSGDDQTEYLTFKKKVYAFQNLIHRMS